MPLARLAARPVSCAAPRCSRTRTDTCSGTPHSASAPSRQRGRWEYAHRAYPCMTRIAPIGDQEVSVDSDTTNRHARRHLWDEGERGAAAALDLAVQLKRGSVLNFLEV